MNIVLIGCSSSGKFGNDFYHRAKTDGHTVYSLSHMDHNLSDQRHAFGAFDAIRLEDNSIPILTTYQQLIAEIDNIDIFLYNSNDGAYPGNESALRSSGAIDICAWKKSLDVQVVVPHILILESLKKMSSSSGIVFMTTGLSYDLSLKDHEYSKYVGYAGFKSVQNHLMMGLAAHNDKGAICTSVASHFTYDDPGNYNIIFNRVYDYITNLTAANNGKIRQIWPGTESKDVN
jgi:hypothetical protein